MPETLPYPPFELASRVGSLRGQEDPFKLYDLIGRLGHDHIVALLPDSWSFEGKRVLDFGCGAGRTMRHFLDEAEVTEEFWGCDLDEESISWMDQHMCPPFRVFTSEAAAGLDFPDGHFDLIYAVSVFTHLTDQWSNWMAELHRVLAPNGLLVATFMGEGMSQDIANEPWQEDRVGMNALVSWQGWDAGGPMVLHSPWWIEAHWGRAFKLLAMRPSGFALEQADGRGQGIVALKRRDEKVTPEDLQAPSDDPRELTAALHLVEQIRKEAGWLQTRLTDVDAALAIERQAREQAESELRMVTGSRSWRLTAPLRRLKSRAVTR